MANVTGQLLLDKEIQAVLEFMQAHIPTDKLVPVAEFLPGIARLLWGGYQQTSLVPLVISSAPLDVQPRVANESGPAGRCADGGFAAEADRHSLT